jgi:hypothetical protein
VNDCKPLSGTDAIRATLEAKMAAILADAQRKLAGLA